MCWNVVRVRHRKEKILVINSSPRTENGATEIILDKFLDGAKSAGAEVEKIYTNIVGFSRSRFVK